MSWERWTMEVELPKTRHSRPPKPGALMLLETHYPESRFGGFTDLDGTITFYARVNELIPPSGVVLDVGCGRGASAEDPVAIRRELRSLRVRGPERVIGLDVDPNAAGNPLLDEFVHIVPGDPWPIEDGLVHVLVSDNTLEHISEPDRFFAEASRVLVPGGHICLRTPNAWGYVAVLSRLVPNRYHSLVTAMAQPHRREEDVFPTYYRCNTVPLLKAALSKHGFNGIAYGYEAAPSYLAFSSLAYRLGVLYGRHAPGLLKPAIFVFGKKVG